MASLSALSLTIWRWWRRDRYSVLTTLRPGPVKERLVCLPWRGIQNVRLRQEIKIFNRLNLVMPTVHGVAVAYQQQLQALIANPRQQPNADPYEQLFYGYACDVLAQKTADPLVRRQLKKNLLFLLAPKRKIVQKRRVVWSPQRYELYPTPLYKIFSHSYLDLSEPQFQVAVPLTRYVHGSYLKYYHQDLIIKQAEDFYELTTVTEQNFTLQLAPDKSDYDCTVVRGIVTTKNLVTGQVHTYTVRGNKFRLATSVCAPTDALTLTVTWQGRVTISIDHAVRHLLSADELAFNRQVEQIVNAAYQAKYVTGEKLRQRYQAAVQSVPSLALLSRVVLVTQKEDFLSVLDQLPAYRQAAQLFGGFNLIFLYSGANCLVADLVAEYLSTALVTTCRVQKLLLFFLDRTVIEPDALYYLTKLAGKNCYEPVAVPAYPLQMTQTYPYRKTLTLANPQAQPQTINTFLPLIFPTPSVVSTQGNILTAVSLVTGKTTQYQLPVSWHLPAERLTTHVNVPIKMRLQGFETKVLTLQRAVPTGKATARQQQLITTLENIVIKTTDPQLDQLFTKPVVDDTNPALLALVKLAYKSVDRKLLLSVLEDKHHLTFDVWQYLLTKAVGLRLSQNKIHLVPCVNLLGDFSLSCTWQGEKYTFSTRKGLANSVIHAKLSHGQKIKRY